MAHRFQYLEDEFIGNICIEGDLDVVERDGNGGRNCWRRVVAQVAQVVQLVFPSCCSGIGEAGELAGLWLRDRLRENGLHIGLFSNPLPVEKGIDRYIVLGAPVLDGETALPLFVEQGSPFGKVCLVHGLINIHENTSCVSCSSCTSHATEAKFLELLSHEWGKENRYA